LSGVPIGTLNKISNGTTKDPKLETLKALAKVLGCTMDDFKDSIQNKNSTIVVHFNRGEYTEEELDEIKKFAEFLKNKRK